MLKNSLGIGLLVAGLAVAASPLHAVHGQSVPTAQTPFDCIEANLTDAERQQIRALIRTARIPDLLDNPAAGSDAAIARVQLTNLVGAAAGKCALTSSLPGKRISAEIPVHIALYASDAAWEDTGLSQEQTSAIFRKVHAFGSARLQRISRKRATDEDIAAVDAIFDNLENAPKTPQARDAFNRAVRGTAHYADLAGNVDGTASQSGGPRGYIGIGFSPVTSDIAAALGLPAGIGELVTRRDPGGPAARDGLKVGDVILSVDGQKAVGDPPLPAMIGSKPPGARITVEIMRDGKRLFVGVELGVRPSEEAVAKNEAPAAPPPLKPKPARPATNYLPPEGYAAGSCTFKEVPELGLTGVYVGQPAWDGTYKVVIFDHPDWTNKAVRAEVSVSFKPNKPYSGFELGGVSFRFAASGYDLPGVVPVNGTMLGTVDILLDGEPIPFKVVPSPQHGMIFGKVEFKDKAEVRQFLDLLARSRTLTFTAKAANMRPLAQWTLDVSSFAKAEDVLRRSEFRCV